MLILLVIFCSGSANGNPLFVGYSKQPSSIAIMIAIGRSICVCVIFLSIVNWIVTVYNSTISPNKLVISYCDLQCTHVNQVGTRLYIITESKRNHYMKTL